jgi:hypothetical protein
MHEDKSGHFSSLMLGTRIHLTSNLVSVSKSGGRSFLRAAIDCDDGWSASRKLTVNVWTAISAPGSLCAEAGQGLPPFPTPLCPLAFPHNRGASVATLSDGVRDHPGMPFGFLSD